MLMQAKLHVALPPAAASLVGPCTRLPVSCHKVRLKSRLRPFPHLEPRNIHFSPPSQDQIVLLLP